MLAVACVTAAPAAAQDSADQDVSPNTSVRERAKPEYDALGVSLGAFRLLTSARTDFVYDTNVFGEADDLKTEDAFVQSVVGAALVSTWSNRSLRLAGRVEDRRYFELDSENRTNYNVNIEARINTSRRNALFATYAQARLTEFRDATQTIVGADSPVRFSTRRLVVGADFRQDRWEQRVDVSFSDIDFDDVSIGGAGSVDQDFRDSEAIGTSARIGYRVLPFVGLFVRAAYETRDYSTIQPRLGVLQDSETFVGAGGVFFDIAKVARADIAVGYIQRDYEDDLFFDLEGVRVDAQLEYFLSGITTLTVDFDRDIQEANILTGGGFFLTSVGGRVDHELLRNLVLSLEGRYRQDDIFQSDQQAENLSAGLDIEYRPRRGWRLRAGYDWRNLSPSGGLLRPAFDRHQFSLSVEFRI
ncbi:MAG: outer membrane beta-barrel protein [Pseudomonadota bacterium]